jgi:hypothetical protein
MADERVFEKDDQQVTTASPTAAVDLKARGFREVLEPEARPLRDAEQTTASNAAARQNLPAQPTPPKPDYPKSD